MLCIKTLSPHSEPPKYPTQAFRSLSVHRTIPYVCISRRIRSRIPAGVRMLRVKNPLFSCSKCNEENRRLFLFPLLVGFKSALCAYLVMPPTRAGREIPGLVLRGKPVDVVLPRTGFPSIFNYQIFLRPTAAGKRYRCRDTFQQETSASKRNFLS